MMAVGRLVHTVLVAFSEALHPSEIWKLHYGSPGIEKFDIFWTNSFQNWVSLGRVGATCANGLW